MVKVPDPLQVHARRLREKDLQFLGRKALPKLGHLAALQGEVGQLDGHRAQAVIAGMDGAVKPRLRPVQRVGLATPSALDCLDFLDQGLRRRLHQPVNSALNPQDELVGLEVARKTNLFLIADRTGALETLMPPDARQGPVGPHEIALAPQSAPPQDELDQLANLDGGDRFWPRCHTRTFGRRDERGNRNPFRVDERGVLG